MNPRDWMKQIRFSLSKSCVALFGIKKDGGIGWGSGILIDLRGTPLILTCAHVIEPLEEPVFVVSDRYQEHSNKIYKFKISDSILDWGCLVLGDATPLAGKCFISANEVILKPISPEEAVLLYGFPIGHKKLQVGGDINAELAQTHFKSMTHLSLTGISMRNSRLGFVQARVDWTPEKNRDFKNFTPVYNFSKYERGGFSGGPVLLANSRRLVGQITDASDYSFFYNPIDIVLSDVDKKL